MEDQRKVIQLVGIREYNKRLYLTQEGKYFLENIDGPVSVISIAGLYRTGKSFLVNELLDKFNHGEKNSQQKFQVGSTIQSCTKGLNVWGVPFISKNSDKKFHYIIVDSEGIGSMDQQLSYDINLLMVIFLISSTVIYNSIGAIDEQGLDQLRVIVNLKKSFSGQENSQPRLIWALRDFALQLINKKGHSLTENEYLEDCLQCTNSSNKQVLKKNEIRQAIKSYLPNRECFTFVRPTIKQEELQNLPSLPKNRLRPQFNDQINRLFDTVFRNDIEDIKYLNDPSNFITGPTLCQMIEYYLNEINCNKVPQIKSLWQLIQSTKLDQLFEECESQFKKQVIKIDLPQNEERLKERLNQIQTVIYEKFLKELPQNNIKVYKQFTKWFLNVKDQLRNKTLKVNREQKNKKALKFVRDNINKHIQFDKIDPCSMTQVKQVIQSLKLKVIGEIQPYEYVLATLFDIIEIAQQKTIKLQNELTLWQESKKQTQLERNIKDDQVIRMKQNYHEALKEISLLKGSQMSDNQELAVLRQEFQLLQEKCRAITTQKLQKQNDLRGKIDELNEKIRKKNEESNESIKNLHIQNQTILQELQQAKKQLNNSDSSKRKELIFEQKIKESWDRFEEERIYLKNQLTKFKQLYYQTEEKTRLLAEKQEKLQTVLRNQRDSYLKKERQFCSQLKWMKENYSKTKQAYSQSLNTRIQNQKILQDVTVRKKNTIVVMNNKKEETVPNTSRVTTIVDKSAIEELTLICEDLKKENENFAEEKESLLKEKENLVKEIEGLFKVIKDLKQKLLENQRINNELKFSYELKLQELQQKNEQLQYNNEEEKQRFYSCLKQLQNTKQQERKMYEQSIVRLLNNIEGLDSKMMRPQTPVYQKQTSSLTKSYKFSKKHLY